MPISGFDPFDAAARAARPRGKGPGVVIMRFRIGLIDAAGHPPPVAPRPLLDIFHERLHPDV